MKDCEMEMAVDPVGFDENMPEVPRVDETADERASRMGRESERSGTEAEWNEIANPDDAAPPEPHRAARPARVKALPKPTAPTREQREIHEMCHYPYASWCAHCVRGKAVNNPHRKLKKHAACKSEPVVSGDFCFLSQADDASVAPVFVLRDHRSRVTFAHVTQGKSTSKEVYSQYLTKAVVEDMKALGHPKLVFKTDQEPAMVALQECVEVARDVRL